MAGQIKGITVVFDAKTTALTTALKKVKAEARGVQTDLNAVNRQLKLDPHNTELLAQKQQLLKQKIETTKDALTKYKDIQRQLDTKNVDRNSTAYMRVRREIIAAQAKLKQFNAQAAQAKWSGLKTLGTNIQGVGQKLTRATRYARMFVGALAGIALYKGFQRLKSLDETSKQLEVLGYRGEKLDKVMDAVSGSVNGTRFMLQDMAKVASGALGSGVTEKYDLNAYLTKTADLAQLAGIDVQSMGAMLNKAYASGKVNAKIMNQLNAHGIPIYKLLQKELGVDSEKLAELSKAGQISFDDLYRATSKYNGLAQKMGTETLPGAVTVLTQQFGLIGADFLSGVYEPLKGGIKGLVAAIKELRQNGTFKEWGQDLGDVFKYFIQYFTEGSASVDGLSSRAQGLVEVLSPLVKTIGGIVQLVAGLPPQLQGVLAFMTLFGGPLLTGVGSAVSGFASLATNVQTFAMNAAAGVGPTASLSSGMGTMSGALGLLVNPFTIVTAAVGAWAFAIKDANDKLHESTTAFEEWQAGNQVGIEAAQASGAEVDLYKQKLISLMGKEKKSAGDKALIKTYVDKLNGAVSGLNLKYDEEEDKLNMTRKAIEKKIQKYKEAALVKAYEDLITEAAKKEAEEQLHLQELYKERKEIQDKWNNSADHSVLLETQYKQSLAKVNAKIADSKGAIKGYKGEMDKAANAVKGLSGSSKKGFKEGKDAAKKEGEETPKKYSDSIEKGKGKAKTASKKVAKEAKAGLEYNPFSLGVAFSDGYKDGIKSKAKTIAIAAAQVVRDAVNAAKKEQNSGSPSKVMRKIGREYGEGYQLGIGDEAYSVQGAARHLVSTAIGAATRPAAGLTLAGASAAAGGTGGMYVNANINISGTNAKAAADEFIMELEQQARIRNEGY